MAHNTYDEVGRLDTKKVGARSDANFVEILPPLQTIKYNYNIRGWTTGINLTNDGKLDTGKLFSYKIKYNDPANTTIKNYNGNISEVDWTYGLNNHSRYEYTYDTVNRLKGGEYKTFNETTTTDSRFFNEAVTYDVNGNIIGLERNARPRTGLTANQVDDLVYSYESLSNRIATIYDNTQNNNGYPAVMIPQPISYDANGNMLTMPDKGISTPILYNYLNLPQVIVKNTQPVTYTYRADGVKVHKSFEVNGQNIQTWYLDGFIYTTPYTPDIVIALNETPEAEEMSLAGQRESFELAEKVIVDPGGPGEPMVQSKPDFFATAEGFYDFNTFRYIYQYKDHLGNTRLNFARDEDNLLYSEDRNDYYPFGLNFINPVSFGPAQLYNPSATYKNYKYNGMELQETGMYDYGARMYMPDIGRWGVVDPLAEKAQDLSPYRYGYNNPILFIDPTGMLETDFVDIESGVITHIEDGKNQVIASDKNTIENMKNLSENNVDTYNKMLTVFENSSLNLDMTRSEFDFLAQTLYAESSGGFGESLGILNVLENRAKMDGNSVMDQLSDEVPYGVYGVRDRGRYTDEKGAKADAKRSNVHRAIAIGLTTDGDVTNGAYFWDGRDIQTNSHYKSWGVKFSKPGHNLWNQNDKSGRAQLITTASHGKTIFTKFENQGNKWSISK